MQTVMTAQELYAKAALIPFDSLEVNCRISCDLAEAEECFRESFWLDVRPLVREWRESRGLPTQSALAALRQSGYVEQIAQERGSQRTLRCGWKLRLGTCNLFAACVSIRKHCVR